MDDSTDTVKAAAEDPDWRAREERRDGMRAREAALHAALSFHKERADINAVTAATIAESAKTFETYLRGDTA